MTRSKALLLTAIALVAIITSVSLPLAYAATAPSNPLNAGQALEIAPPVSNLTVNPGQTVTVTIYLRDISKTNLIVTGQANDFIAAGEDGTPKILLDPSETSPYSLKDWVQGLPSLQLIPREIKAMNVTLKVPTTASPGGHYGVIRFTATPPDLQSTGVSLSASLGALLLVTVTGKINEDVTLENFAATQNNKASSLFETPPITFTELFKNSGNVHEEPTGQVVVNDMLGHKFAVVNVNNPPRNVLPASERKFSQTIDSSVIGNKIMLGRYTATLSVAYGANKQTLTRQITFWVIPYRLIIASVAGLIGAFFGLRFLIRRYNRRIIAQAQRSRRR